VRLIALPILRAQALSSPLAPVAASPVAASPVAASPLPPVTASPPALIGAAARRGPRRMLEHVAW
jgi:hypothetical protein